MEGHNTAAQGGLTKKYLNKRKCDDKKYVKYVTFWRRKCQKHS